jgi:hypothetical protein
MILLFILIFAKNDYEPELKRYFTLQKESRRKNSENSEPLTHVQRIMLEV